jgi:AcrR family transcriptional regulator
MNQTGRSVRSATPVPGRAAPRLPSPDAAYSVDLILGLPLSRAVLSENRSSPIRPKAVAATPLSPAIALPEGALPHERIVAAAREMFCRNGIHATGVDRILATAGASKMTLYARFGSKEALVRVALREEGQVWRDAFAAHVTSSAEDPQGRLRAIVPALAGWFRGGRFYGCAFINAAAEHTKGEPWLRALAVEHRAACLEFLEGLAREAGYAAPDALAPQLMLLIDGAVAALMVSGDEAVLQTAARMLDALLAVEERVPA